MASAKTDTPWAIVVGIGPVGRGVAARLEQQQMRVCAVDLSPVNLYPLAQQGFETVAGDATDPNTLDRASARDAQLAVICVPNDDVAVRVVATMRQLNPTCVIVVRCRFLQTIPNIEKVGANAVVSEEAESSKALVDTIADLSNARGGQCFSGPSSS